MANPKHALAPVAPVRYLTSRVEKLEGASVLRDTEQIIFSINTVFIYLWFIVFNSCFSLRNQTGSLRSLQWARGAGEVRSDVLGTPMLAGHLTTDPALFPNFHRSVGARRCCGSSNENQRLHTPVCGWCRHAGPVAWLRHLLFPGPSLDLPAAALHRLLSSQALSWGFCSSSEFFALENHELLLSWSCEQFSNLYLSVRSQVRSRF